MNEEENTSLSSSEGTRVLLFIQLLELGGSETQCVELARRLAAEGYLGRWWWYTPARRKLLRRIQRFSTRVLVNSEAVRQELITRDGFAPERIVVVHNGIDTERFAAARADREKLIPGTSANDKLIIMTANMHTGAKGHGDLIEAARTVRDRKSTRLNSSHTVISYAVFCLKKKKTNRPDM